MLGRVLPHLTYMQGKLTKRVATGELRLLCVFCSQFVSDAVEQLNVALLRVLLESRNERPRHGASGLRSDSSVGPGKYCQLRILCLTVR